MSENVKSVALDANGLPSDVNALVDAGYNLHKALKICLLERDRKGSALDKGYEKKAPKKSGGK